MVIGQRKRHGGIEFDLSVLASSRGVYDPAGSDDPDLRRVQNRGETGYPERAQIGNGKASAVKLIGIDGAGDGFLRKNLGLFGNLEK